MAGRALGGGWNQYTVGGGGMVRMADGLRFICPPTAVGRYVNAQLDDYQGLPRKSFRWKPPLTLSVRARFSHEDGVLRGTAGFGFWNDPFLMTGRRPPTLPQAAWFFYASLPSDMALAQGVPGQGWKAATLDVSGWRGATGLMLLPSAAPWMHLSRYHHKLWPFFQGAFRVAEAPIADAMVDWHEYLLSWQPDSISFAVDGQQVLCAGAAPAGPLGFVAWLDNQWMIARPSGRLGHGTLMLPNRQWMEVAEIAIRT